MFFSGAVNKTKIRILYYKNLVFPQIWQRIKTWNMENLPKTTLPEYFDNIYWIKLCVEIFTKRQDV